MSALKSFYEILLDYNLVIEYHSGILETSSYINFKKELFSDPKFKPNLNHFIYFKNVEFATTQPDINEFVVFMGNHSKSIGYRKLALITDTPNQVVSTTIYKMIQKNLNQSVEIFSTNKKAFKWLKIPDSEINNMVNILVKFINQ